MARTAELAALPWMSYQPWDQLGC
jgi:hypothetical protein